MFRNTVAAFLPAGVSLLRSPGGYTSSCSAAQPMNISGLVGAANQVFIFFVVFFFTLCE